MRNQTSFRLTTTLLPTDTTAKTTQVINKVDSDGNKFYPSFTEETVVLTNDDRTIMETTKATCTNGVLTFVKRGLSDDSSETQVANRKLTWNPGTICFITAGAGDWIDIDDNLTWTGKQTYTGDLESQGKATYKGQLITEKGVKYPNFEDTTALEAYADPFGGMFATVDNTGELYRYNAVTEQWDLVSTADLGTYTIRSDTTPPAEGTADTIITLNPTTGNIYLGDKVLVGMTKPLEARVNLTAVGGGGAGAGAGCWCNEGIFGGSGGGGGEVLDGRYVLEKKAYDVVIGCGGQAVNEYCDVANYPGYLRNGCDGGDTKFGDITAHGGQGGRLYLTRNRTVGGTSGNGYSGATPCVCFCGGAGGAGAACAGSTCGSPYRCGGQGGDGKCGFGGGGGGGARYFSGGDCGGAGGCGGGGAGGNRCQSGCNATCYGGGGGGGAAEYDYNTGGGCGCQGVVIVRYPADGSGGISCATGGTITCETINSVDYCVHTFTSNGTFTIVS